MPGSAGSRETENSALFRELLSAGARSSSGRARVPGTAVDLHSVPLINLMDEPIEADDERYVHAFYGEPLEPKIVPLVRVLQAVSFGFRTKGSCEGHLDRGYHPYPSVEIKIDYGFGRGALEEMVAGFNRTSCVRWSVNPDTAAEGRHAVLRPDAAPTFAISQEDFDGLQASAGDLAGFLYYSYVADREVRMGLSRLYKRLMLAEVWRGNPGRFIEQNR
jgi:hypothetical protein